MKKFLFGAAALSLLAFTVGCNNEGESCKDALDCPGTQICVSGTCQAPGTGGQDDCVMDEECDDGYMCSDAGKCVVDPGNPGGNQFFNRVLLVSRTPSTTANDNNDCRAPNPGPDIDFVSVQEAGEVIMPKAAAGAHGDYCGSEDMGPNDWAEPSVAIQRLSIPEVTPGECNIDDAKTKYYFMGTGQAYEPGETIKDKTGVLVLDFEGAINDGSTITVWEVNGKDGSETETCTNVPAKRPNDAYGVYLVSNKAPTNIGVGTQLDGADFIYLGEGVGIKTFTVTLD